LADAEIEYHDHVSPTVWVKFPVKAYDEEHYALSGNDAGDNVFRLQPNDASVVIWTTTPWTIPANRAISFSSKVAYGLYEVSSAPDGNWASTGEKYVLADKLAADTFAKAKVEAFVRLQDVPPAVMSGLMCHHPLRGLGGGYNFEVPLLDGEHVTDDAGTGFVHTAPGHGLDDFEIWMNSARLLGEKGVDTAIPYVVGDDGYYTSEAPGLEGGRVIDDNGKKGDANNRVIAALAERNAMVARGRVKHSYPHSWRSKKPVIFRNTPQWFVYMDRDIEGAAGDTLRHRALNAIDATKFYPSAGQNRLRAMIADRPDWVLSRQRAWGVPITVFVHKETQAILKDDAVNHRIAQSFEEEGADAWYKPGAAQRYLGDAYKADDYEMVTDVLDVWFDSGSTHAFVLRNKQKWPHLKFPASMYLEGSDQHRGWFHSSLLESCATNGHAPYESVLTHGFTMDGEGKKMSKSLGNTVAPQDIIKQYGADILRLWVASSDYSEDLRLGKDIIQTTVDSYRKLRNTLRWLLGNLAHYDAKDEVRFEDMPELEQLMLHRLAQLDEQVRGAYKDYDYRRIVTLLTNFMNIELSAFYFDIRKDTLYCDPISSIKRKASLTVLNHLFNCLTAWLAPILVFTMEEVWLERHPEDGSSVHLRLFPEVPAEWLNDDLAAKWSLIRAVRRVVTGALEIERREKRIGSSLEAAPKVFITDERYLTALAGEDLAEIAITSAIQVGNAEAPPEAFTLEDVPGVAVVPGLAEGTRCARSWKVLPEVGSDPEYPDVSPRDAQALRERAQAGL